MKTNKFHLYSSLSLAIFIAILAMQFVFCFNGSNKANSINKVSNLFLSATDSDSSKPISENNILLSIDELEEDETFNEKNSIPLLIFSVLVSNYQIREIDNTYISQSLITPVSSIPLRIKNCIYLI